MASTGHSGTHRVQSMHSSGSMTSMFGPSRKQSTGHTSTQSVYLHLTQLSVTTYVIAVLYAWCSDCCQTAYCSRNKVIGAAASTPLRFPTPLNLVSIKLEARPGSCTCGSPPPVFPHL